MTPSALYEVAWLRRSGIALVALLVGGVLGWAGATVFAPPPGVPTDRNYTFAAVEIREVGASIALMASAEWPTEPVGTNQAAGIVTSIAASPGESANPGDQLYTVDLRPVVVAQGAVPAFRSLARGASGADVQQLQAMLNALGNATVSSGTFDWATQTAVRSWQRAAGYPVDGVVQAGDIIFVPTLPTRVALDSASIYRGAQLSGGEAVLSQLPPQPDFEIPVTREQVPLIPLGTRVEISAPDGSLWVARVGRQRADGEQLELVLDSLDDGPICADSCALIDLGGPTLLSTTVVTVEPVTGLAVPSAALRSTADGSTVVIDDDGEQHTVVVTTSARGMSIVQGVKEGTRVRVPASTR